MNAREKEIRGKGHRGISAEDNRKNKTIVTDTHTHTHTFNLDNKISRNERTLPDILSAIQLFDADPSEDPVSSRPRAGRADAPSRERDEVSIGDRIGEQSHPAADCLFRYLKVSSVSGEGGGGGGGGGRRQRRGKLRPESAGPRADRQ